MNFNRWALELHGLSRCGIIYCAIVGFYEPWDTGKMSRISLWDISMQLIDSQKPRPVPGAFTPRQATVRVRE